MRQAVPAVARAAGYFEPKSDSVTGRALAPE